VSTELKKPFNRKLLWVLVFSVAAMGVVSLVMVSFNDPRENLRQQQREAELLAIKEQQPGDAEAALRLLENENARLQRELEASQRERTQQQDLDTFDKAFNPSLVQNFDPDMLRLLDEAQQEVSRPPELAREVTSTVTGRGGNGQGGEGTGLVYDNYSKRGVFSSDDEESDLFDDGHSRAEPGVYEAARPLSPPAERIVSQGSSIHAVLMSNIDTRNDGEIIAMTTRDVYDSRTMRQKLIPQGSRLVGQYSTNPTPGADRLEVNFSRLIMPDGRAFDLPGTPSSGGDGTLGIKGKYRSNLFHAIGPSFVVAFLGQVIDRRTKKDIPVNEGSVVAGPGGLQQAPSILEQVTPQINQEIMQRYQGARPYFLVKPGQRIRLQLTEDVEVPLPNQPASGGVR